MFSPADEERAIKYCEEEGFKLFEDLRFVEASFYAKTVNGQKVIPMNFKLKIEAELKKPPKPIVIDEDSSTEKVLTKFSRLDGVDYSQYIKSLVSEGFKKYFDLKQLSEEVIKSFKLPEKLKD